MKLYHLTDIEVVPSILEKGLLINTPARIALEDNKFIYVTTSIEKLIEQEGEWQVGNLGIIEIDYIKVIGMELRVDWELVYHKEESPFAFYFIEDIEPNYIKFVGTVNDSVINMF